MAVDGLQSRSPLKVSADPRAPVDGAALRNASAFYADLATALDRNFVAYAELQAVDKQIAEIEKKLAPADATGNAKDPAGSARSGSGKAAGNTDPLRAAIEKFKTATKTLRSGDEEAGTNLGAIGDLLATTAADIEGSDRAPTPPQRDVLAECNDRMTRAAETWERAKREQLAQVDAQLQRRGMPAIAIPAADCLTLENEADSQELP